jgi:crotonobetainyl-CoA:carnitine CoA-transferase CaiB-like acyl-CoA transferase
MVIFENLKIIDLSTVLAGPSVASFFAELGAEVIKIEHPSKPDVTRSWKLPNEDQDNNVSAYFSSINYKKKYIQLNLQNSSDYEEFVKLVKDCSILISNFKKGDDIKLNITDEILRQQNPNLIIGKINGYGSESDRVAYDLILQAETGFMSMNGTPTSGAVKMPVALIDVLAAHHLKEGLLLALLEQQKSGSVKTIEVSLYDAAVCSLTNQASNYLMAGHVPERIGSLHPNIAPYGEIFTTKDQRQITFAIGSNQHFEKLCVYLNLVELKDNPKFQNNQNRVLNRIELFEILEKKIVELSSEIIFEAMKKLNVPCGIIKNLAEVFGSEQAKKLVREEEIDGKSTKRTTSIAFEWN